jgi:hypothetical protein
MTQISVTKLLWIAVGWCISVSECFTPLLRHGQGAAKPTISSTALHCICINCARVTNCAAYHFVEAKHEQPHINKNPTWEPRDGSPTIQVNIRSIRSVDDRKAEVERMWREHKSEEARAETIGGNELHGTTVYDFTPSTTYEYDVVQCADYVEEKGAWVKNMPLEIRNANPHFVPS